MPQNSYKGLMVIVIIILSILLFAQYKQISNLKRDNDRWFQNFNQKDSLSRTYYFTKREFSDYVIINNNRLFDSISKIAGFKVGAKNIKEYVTYNYTYHNTDTIMVKTHSVSDTIYNFSATTKDSCVFINGYLYTKLNQLFITDIKFKNINTDSYYFKRKKALFGIRIGKKQFYHTVMSSCPNSTTKSEYIEIGKQQ